jgi:hypothetical protein
MWGRLVLGDEGWWVSVIMRRLQNRLEELSQNVTLRFRTVSLSPCPSIGSLVLLSSITFYPANWGSRFLRNVGNLPPGYIARLTQKTGPVRSRWV